MIQSMYAAIQKTKNESGITSLVTNTTNTPCGRPHSDEMCKFCIDLGLSEIFEVDGMYQMVNTSDFDADVFFNENIDQVDNVCREEVCKELDESLTSKQVLQ